MTKGADNHTVPPRATELSGRWIAKGVCRLPSSVSTCHRTLGSLDSKGCLRVTVGCLRIPPDSWVTVTKVGVVNKSRAFAPTYPQFVKRNSDLRSSWLCETKIVSVFFTKMRTCFSKETKPPTDQSNIWFFDEKQCVYWGRRVCWWNFLITINEILDVSISFLNDHLEETLGPTK